jgi:hypothetical protein
MTQADKEGVLWRNAVRFYGLKADAATPTQPAAVSARA